MRSKALDFDELYDVRGLRVLVDNVKDCYTALGIVHNLWQPMPKEFDDYISRPKGNDYRSLHTAVFGPGRPRAGSPDPHPRHASPCRARRGRALALQGRRQGRAAAPAGPLRREDRLAAPGARLARRGGRSAPTGSSSSSRRRCRRHGLRASRRRAGCSTCRRDSTPVDFAYALHTDSAITAAAPRSTARWCRSTTSCRTASASRSSPRSRAGRAATGSIRRCGYIASSRARNKVRQWFNAEELARHRRRGPRRGRAARCSAIGHDRRQSRISWRRQLGFEKPDELFAAVGREEVGRARAADRAARRGRRPSTEEEIVARKSKAVGRRRHPGRRRGPADDAACASAASRRRPIRSSASSPAGAASRSTAATARASATCSPSSPSARSRPRGAAQGTACSRWTSSCRRTTARACCATSPKCSPRSASTSPAVNTLSKQNVATMQFTAEVGDVDHLRRALAQVAEVPGVFSARRR